MKSNGIHWNDPAYLRYSKLKQYVEPATLTTNMKKVVIRSVDASLTDGTALLEGGEGLMNYVNIIGQTLEYGRRIKGKLPKKMLEEPF